MGVHADTVPEWLISSWVRSCQEAGATADTAILRQTAINLLRRWDDQSRKYHGISHLLDVLSHVDELCEEAHEPDLVRLAAWYHGAVFSAEEAVAYANRGGENEEASADLARTELTALGIPATNVARVATLIDALLRHTVLPKDFDCAVLCDAELAVLAAEPQRYQSYLSCIRAEYAHIPVRDYIGARIAILTKLQRRERIFASGIARAWEDQARQNVEAELSRLHTELAKLDAAALQDASLSTP